MRSTIGDQWDQRYVLGHSTTFVLACLCSTENCDQICRPNLGDNVFLGRGRWGHQIPIFHSPQSFYSMVIFSVFVIFIMSAIVGTVAHSPVDAGAALKFFNTVGKLKTLKRTGWVNNTVFEPESVADHMYRMSMLGFLITDPAVNKDRLIKVCLIHDLAESIVGDITPYDGVTKEQKRKLEQDAMKLIVDGLGNQAIADELMGLWLEYEEGDSTEADVARQLDKYEMIVQVGLGCSIRNYCILSYSALPLV